MNYLVSYSAVDTALSANLIDALVDYDPYGNILPGLAESWESNEDMTEWTFHIRKGAGWYDWQGKFYAPVTADDWVASAQYVNDAANDSEIQYMYATGSVVVKAQDHFEYTDYQLHPEAYDITPRKIEASVLFAQLWAGERFVTGGFAELQQVVIYASPLVVPMENGEQSIGLLCMRPMNTFIELMNLTGEDSLVSFQILREDGSYVIRNSESLGDTTPLRAPTLRSAAASTGLPCRKAICIC